MIMIIFKFAFILLALRSYSAYAHEVNEINRNKLMAAGENVMSSQKELSVVATTRMILGGRKMMMAGDSRKKMIEVKKDQSRGDETSKISGYDTFKRARSIDQGLKPHQKASSNESQNLFDQAADEILNLMRKDYGKGPMKPRHKPPINNNEPEG